VGDIHWVGGVLVSIQGGVTTLRLLSYGRPSHWRDVAAAVALLPAGVSEPGCPIACRIAADYTVLEVIGSSFQPGDVPVMTPAAMAAALAAGRAWFGIIPDSVTQLPAEYEWTALD